LKKVIAIGDIHGRQSWKSIVNTNEWDEIVFIGDYFDSFDFTGLEQMSNFQEIINFKRNSEKPVILLIGNHDMHYFPEIGYNQTAGYQAGVAQSISHLINENRDCLQMAYSHQNILFTHAGVGLSWMERINAWEVELPPINAFAISEWINDIWKYKPRLFNFIGNEPTGDNMGQTPVWIRPRSLMKDGKELKNAGIIQVVGHTHQNQIDIKGKATGGKYYFIDTLGSSGEYLIIEGDKFSTKTV